MPKTALFSLVVAWMLSGSSLPEELGTRETPEAETPPPKSPPGEERGRLPFEPPSELPFGPEKPPPLRPEGRPALDPERPPPFAPEKLPPWGPGGPGGFDPGGFGPGGGPGFGPDGGPGFGPDGGPGFGPAGSPGGPGGPGRKREVVKEFDEDGEGRLNREERLAARKALQGERRGGPGGPGGFGPPGGPAGFGPPGGPDGFGPRRGPGGRGARGFGPPGGPRGAGGPPGFGPFGEPGEREHPKPGPRVSPDEVPRYQGRPLYDPTVLRTLFFEFEDEDWEDELTDFHRTDVEVPATLVVDGIRYPGVGVRLRGNTSAMVGAGYKRPFNVSIDFTEPDQRLYGYKTLNLLNGHDDPTFLHLVLYLEIARHYLPAPQANLVKVVINGESWGIYVNVQQFDKKFLSEWFPSTKGVRWKVPVAFGGGGGLSYLGEDLEAYKRFYEMKTEDGEAAWKDLANLCRVLSETPPETLEEAVRPILDVDRVLWYLALDNVLVNSDGYWIRASDYCLFRDEKDQFHIIPYDVNETFGRAGGPGFGPGPGGPGFGPGPGGEPGRGGPAFRPGRGGSGLELDPLAGADDPRKPLLSRLLAVPSLRARYLECVQRIAEESLDWERLGPIVEGYRSLIAKEIEADTRKLFSFAAFTDEGDEQGREVGIRTFAEARRTYLLQRIEARSASESDADSPVSREVRAREEASGRGPGAEAISQP